MIAPASFIGFALVFVLSTWVLSALGALAVATWSVPLRRRGPGAERRAAELALAVPPLLGGALSLALSVYSVAGPWMGVADHCDPHGHHLHLCLQHGGAWATEAWAVVLIAGIGTHLLARIAQLGDSVWRARQRLRAVAGASEVISNDDGVAVLRAPSRRIFCFVGGVRVPRIYVASAAWDVLDPSQRRAMIAHEMQHVRGGDVWRSIFLSVLALLGAPYFAMALFRRWQAATERLCDHVAADEIGDPEPVASALVALSRAGACSAFGTSFVPDGAQVADRVVAVLDETSHGGAAASRLTALTAAVTLIAIAVTAVCADPIHHALETLLGAH